MIPPNADAARSPGKLILSGEHAVVYGAPALSVAVACFTDVWFTPIHRSAGLRTAFENLSQGHFYPFDLLKSFKQGLDSRFEAFLRGDLPVQKIMQRPDDLAVYTMVSLMQKLPMPGVSPNLHLPVPGKLSSQSEIPLGAGMGSSSAVIAATIVLYEHLLDAPLSLQERFEKVRYCERLQHGKGSFTDAAAVVYGGVNQVQNDTVQHIPLPDDHNLRQGAGWYWVLQGTPASSTGECVAEVRRNHGQDHGLWQSFTACTEAFHKALDENSNPVSVIRENHRLLQHIGVVPETTTRFAKAVEQAGGAAKISGAGTIHGENAGVVLVYMPEPDAMTALMANYPERRWSPLRMSYEGAHLSGGQV